MKKAPRKKAPRKKAPTKKVPLATQAEKATGRFEEAQTELRTFTDDNDTFIDEMRRLVENYNASLKEATVAVKSQLSNSPHDRLVVGQFGAMKKKKERWDGTALAGLFPAMLTDLFLTELVSYEVNVSKLEQLIRQGELDRDEAYKAFLVEPPTMSMMAGCPKEMKV